ncbi:MAG: flavin reductase family protein [Bacteroidetes bacterium]|nr:MAG: flavin reductase family protein [Bacteroidota bacterium]
MPYRTFTPEELTPSQRHHYLLGSVNPRPICFASTLDKDGRPNLAPYSFFNIFSSTPPVFIFSVNTRRDGSLKDTLRNVKEVPEVVINLVNYPMARQMAICGVEYDTGVNEFDKGGFTPVASEMVKPFRVKESPVQFECRVLETRAMSEKPGAANLIIAEALLIHMDENIFADENTIDPQKIDMVGRMGNFNYCRASGESVFAIRQPPADIALGFDNLPDHLKTSKILSGHYLAMMAGVTRLPASDSIVDFGQQQMIKEFINNLDKQSKNNKNLLHAEVLKYLEKGETENAWKLVLWAEQSGVI